MTDRPFLRGGWFAALLAAAYLCPATLQAKPALVPCRISDADGLVSVAARCAHLTVPEDPGDPEGLKIQLRIAVVPAIATQAKDDPVFLLAGGPGQGAIESYAPILGAYAGLRRERDLVLIDQRGTGGSNRLDCDMPEEAIETGELSASELRALARKCLAKLPGQAKFYTTSVAVRDLDTVREALGFAKINLIGSSYGTRVAQHYARRYPARTRTIVLDAVVPPTLALVPQIAIESQRGLDRVFERCADDPECNQRFPALARQFARVDARLSRAPVAVTIADPVSGEPRRIDVTRSHLITMARMLTYSARAASLLPLVLHEAATHFNYAPLAAQAEMIGEELERSIAMGMHHSVVCAEDAPRFKGAVDRAALRKTYLGPLLLDGMMAICEVWPRGPVDPDFGEPLTSTTPALLLSGDFDPATPAAYGAAAATGFAGSLHVVVPGQGHGQARLFCVQRLIRHFIDAGTAKDLDSACVKQIRPAPFFLTFSGSAP
jgi:pimeloyl-ACP methyl ester carboxylesterase